MKDKANKKGDINKDIDVTRSEHQQAQNEAGNNPMGEEKRPEGSKNKGNPPHRHGSHQEGMAPYNSDDPGMHPSNIDDPEK